MQRPLVARANALGYRTHVFAWKEGNLAEDIAHRYYPISILDKEAILARCRSIGIRGIMTVGSDIAIPTVNYIAERMGLPGNSIECSCNSTDKHLMRERLRGHGLPIPRFRLWQPGEGFPFDFPFMVKATDRSGSRGVRLVHDRTQFKKAVSDAQEVSFSKKVLLEEFFAGRQFSLEFVSQSGRHQFIGLTEEFFTGPPQFVEIAHVMPGRMEKAALDKAIELSARALTALQIGQGVSHVELRMNDDSGDFCFIEIGARMGGDFRNKLVELAYGTDFLGLAVQIAMGREVHIASQVPPKFAFIQWFSDSKDQDSFEQAGYAYRPEQSDRFDLPATREWLSSADRSGYVIGTTDRFPDFLQV